MEQQLSYVGKRLLRPDTIDKVTGKAQYGADVTLPNMLIGKVLTSPHAHANIVRIDTSKAEALQGVVAVITHKDVPKLLFTRSAINEQLPLGAQGAENLDQYILADKARHVGDWVAAVAAEDIYIAEKAVALIEVEYEVLPAVFEPLDAMKPGAPTIHDSREDNVVIQFEHEFNQGDVEKGFAESDFVVEISGRSSKQKQAHLELDVSIADWDSDGRVTIWSPCQNTHLAKKALALKVFGIKEGDVRWISSSVGGGFGARMGFGTEPIAAMLAKVTNRPVKVVLTREEDFCGYSVRTGVDQTFKLGVTKDGTVNALQQDILADSGAYLSHSFTIVAVNMQTALGLLRSPNIKGTGTVVYTNTPTGSGMRGYGNVEGMLFLQQAIDMAAEKVGMDPVEFRLKNSRGLGEPSFFAPAILDSCNLDQCIIQGAASIGWKEKWNGWGSKKDGRYRRGVGMSIMTHATSAGGFLLEHSNAIIKVNEDGSAHLTVSPCEMGQGILGVLSQIAAEATGLRYEDIYIITGDTDLTMFDIGSHASRSTYMIGNAVVDAGQKIKKMIIERAAKVLEIDVDQLDVKEGDVYLKTTPEERHPVSKFSSDAIYDYGSDGHQFTAIGTFQSHTHSPSFQAGFAEIEVDTLTGQIKVEKYVIAHDIGKAINPSNVEGQLEGGLLMGLGFALTEELVIDPKTGIPLSTDFHSYRLPSTLNVPDMDVILVEEPNPTGPYGAKGVGEPGMVNVAPAIANALYDAVGVRLDSVPFSAEKVLAAIEAKQNCM